MKPEMLAKNWLKCDESVYPLVWRKMFALFVFILNFQSKIETNKTQPTGKNFVFEKKERKKERNSWMIKHFSNKEKNHAAAFDGVFVIWDTQTSIEVFCYLFELMNYYVYFIFS